MVGYIVQTCEDGTEAIIFVTRNDICLAKVFDEYSAKNKQNLGNENDKEVRYKYFTERRVQAILELGSWMYSLSNSCSGAKSNHQNSAKAYSGGTTTPDKLMRKTTSNYFDNRGSVDNEESHELSIEEEKDF